MPYCFTNNLQPTTAANVVSDVQSFCFSKEQDGHLKPQKPENSFVQRVSSFNIGTNCPVKNTTLTNSFPIQGLAVQRPLVYPSNYSSASKHPVSAERSTTSYNAFHNRSRSEQTSP